MPSCQPAPTLPVTVWEKCSHCGWNRATMYVITLIYIRYTIPKYHQAIILLCPWVSLFCSCMVNQSGLKECDCSSSGNTCANGSILFAVFHRLFRICKLAKAELCRSYGMPVCIVLLWFYFLCKLCFHSIRAKLEHSSLCILAPADLPYWTSLTFYVHNDQFLLLLCNY